MYLRSGEFYKTLNGEDDQLITIPGNTLKSDTKIKNNRDLHHILLSLRFWGVDRVCEEVVKYCLETSPQLR